MLKSVSILVFRVLTDLRLLSIISFCNISGWYDNISNGSQHRPEEHLGSLSFKSANLKQIKPDFLPFSPVFIIPYETIIPFRFNL